MLTVRDSTKFDWENIPLPDCLHGNAMDSHYTLKVFNVLVEKLKDIGVLNFYENVLAPANIVFTEPEYEGLRVSPDKLKSVGKELKDTTMDIHDSLYDYSQITKLTNLSSTKDLISVLYTDESGFALYPPDNTDKGKPSVNKPTLEILLSQIKQELNSRG